MLSAFLIPRNASIRTSVGLTTDCVNDFESAPESLGLNLRRSPEARQPLVPLCPFPPGGRRGGRVPPTPGHAARRQTAPSRVMRRLPPQEEFQSAPLKLPLCIPS